MAANCIPEGCLEAFAAAGAPAVGHRPAVGSTGTSNDIAEGPPWFMRMEALRP